MKCKNARKVGSQTTVFLFLFRVPWFQYPIIYDIRARPRKISSPTGSKGEYMAFKFFLSSFGFLDLFLKFYFEIDLTLTVKLHNDKLWIKF